MIVDRIHQEKDGLKCELTVSTSRAPLAGMLRQGNFNISAPTTRKQWQNALEERMPGVDWYAALEMICALTLKRWRDGEPVVDLACVEPRSGLPFLLPPFIVEGATSVLFAEGGTGKSLFALAMAVSVATGEELLGTCATRLGPSLYLDWEWDAETHAERLQAICHGAGIEECPTGLIHYRHEIAPVWESAAAIRRHVAETGAVFVIVDSLGFARGGEPESADLTLKTFAAFRTFGVPVLALDHVAKHATDKKHSFGSVYTTNAARMTWRADAVKEEGKNRISVGLSNQKANGRLQKPRGFEVGMKIDDYDRLLSVQFSPADLLDVAGLTSAMTMRDQIRGILRAARESMTVADITTSLEADGNRTTTAVVRACLNRNKGMFVSVGDGWGLRAVEGVAGAT